YYEFLGLSKGDSAEDIKKAYRRLALKHHPDKNGDAETFRELTEIYEVLSDPQKRRLYDLYGPDHDKANGHSNSSGHPFPPGFSMQEVFGSMFGGFQARSNGVGKQKATQIKHTVVLSMEDMYSGKTLRIAGNDLYVDKEISLKQALSGVSCAVKHLDERMIQISVPRGKVTSPGTVIYVKGEGIPVNKGCFFVTIRVLFP
ncbi:unnamed protein product, partial [Ectocarpus sp. 8 AP-2014]